MSGYTGSRFVILTQHGKEAALRPALADAFAAEVVLATGIDTDTFGTFTREIPREGSQLEAARRKAQAALSRIDAPYGLGSEGAFGPDPYGVIPWNVELVVLLDMPRGLEIVGRAQGPAHHRHATVSNSDALDAFARDADFPNHGLVVRPDDEDDPQITKGLVQRAALFAAFDQALARSAHGRVSVESELRAHLNPTRMAMIREATDDLVRRMKSLCPRCQAPGFALVARVPGLPCGLCGSPTHRARAERWACLTGDHEELRTLPDVVADPQWCDGCNP